MIEYIALFLILFVLLLIGWVMLQRIKMRAMKQQLRDALHGKQSLSVKYGKMAEQFMTFLDKYPYDRQQFRFLGSPIDGVQFTDQEVIFIEFKVGTSKLSSSQRKIKALIDEKKVRFEEIRLEER
ncbi:MAG: Holliday junction resolvase-like protein [Nanoarchaeota archaeon]